MLTIEEVFLALLDALSRLGVLADLLAEHVPNVNREPVEVRGQVLCDVLTVRAWAAD